MMRVVLILALSAGSLAGPVLAENCRIDRTTRKCIFVPLSQRTPPDFTVGDEFPVYDHSMIMNIDRYGLDPVDGPWRYYMSGPDIYKVSTRGYKVLEVIRNPSRR